MTKRRINQWIEVCKRMIESYIKNELLISTEGCPLCDVLGKDGECDNCLWMIFEGDSCIGNLEKGYKDRIPRLKRWIKKLEKMKEKG